MRVVTATRYLAVELRITVGPFRDASLGALVEHCNDGSDDFEVAQLLRRNINQHVPSAGIVLSEELREVAACRCQFALRAAELLEHEIGQSRIAFINSDRVLQAFVVTEHQSSFCGKRTERTSAGR